MQRNDCKSMNAVPRSIPTTVTDRKSENLTFSPAVNDPNTRRLTGRQRREKLLAYHVGKNMLADFEQAKKRRSRSMRHRDSSNYDSDDSSSSKEEDPDIESSRRSGASQQATRARVVPTMFQPEDFQPVPNRQEKLVLAEIEKLRGAVNSYAEEHGRFLHSVVSLQYVKPPAARPPASSSRINSAKKSNMNASSTRGGVTDSAGKKSTDDDSQVVANEVASLLDPSYKFDFFQRRRQQIAQAEEAAREADELRRFQSKMIGGFQQQARTEFCTKEVEEQAHEAWIARRSEKMQRVKEFVKRSVAKLVDDSSKIQDADEIKQERVELELRKKLKKDRSLLSPSLLRISVGFCDSDSDESETTFASGKKKKRGPIEDPSITLANFLYQNHNLREAVDAASQLICFEAMKILPRFLYRSDEVEYAELLEEERRFYAEQPVAPTKPKNPLPGSARSSRTHQKGSANSPTGQSLANASNSTMCFDDNDAGGGNAQRSRADKALSDAASFRLFELTECVTDPNATAAQNFRHLEQAYLRKEKKILGKSQCSSNHPVQAVAERHHIWLSLTSLKVPNPPLHAWDWEKEAVREHHNATVADFDDDHLRVDRGLDELSATDTIVDDRIRLRGRREPSKLTEHVLASSPSRVCPTSTSRHDDATGDIPVSGHPQPDPTVLPILELLAAIYTNDANVKEEMLRKVGPVELRLLMKLSTSYGAFVQSLAAPSSSTNDGTDTKKGETHHRHPFDQNIIYRHHSLLMDAAASIIVDASMAVAEIAPELLGSPSDSTDGWRKESTTKHLDDEAAKLWAQHRTTKEELATILATIDTTSVVVGNEHDAQRLALQVLQQNRAVVRETFARLRGELSYLLTGMDERPAILRWSVLQATKQQRHKSAMQKRRQTVAIAAAAMHFSAVGIADAHDVIQRKTSMQSSQNSGAAANPSSFKGKHPQQQQQQPAAQQQQPTFKQMLEDMVGSEDDDLVGGKNRVLDGDVLFKWQQEFPSTSKRGYHGQHVSLRQVSSARPVLSNKRKEAASRPPPLLNPSSSSPMSSARKHVVAVSSPLSDNSAARGSPPKRQNDLSTPTAKLPPPTSGGSILKSRTVVPPEGTTCDDDGAMTLLESSTKNTKIGLAVDIASAASANGLNRVRSVVITPTGAPAVFRSPASPRSSVASTVNTPLVFKPPRLNMNQVDADSECKGGMAKTHSTSTLNPTVKGGGPPPSATGKAAATFTRRRHSVQKDEEAVERQRISNAKASNELTMTALQQELVALERRRRRSGKPKAPDPTSEAVTLMSPEVTKPLIKVPVGETQYVVFGKQLEAFLAKQRLTQMNLVNPTQVPFIPVSPPTSLRSKAFKKTAERKGLSVPASVVGEKQARVVEKFKLASKRTMQHCFSSSELEGQQWYETGKPRVPVEGLHNPPSANRGGGGGGGVNQGRFDVLALSPITAMRLALPTNVLKELNGPDEPIGTTEQDDEWDVGCDTAVQEASRLKEERRKANLTNMMSATHKQHQTLPWTL